MAEDRFGDQAALRYTDRISQLPALTHLSHDIQDPNGAWHR
jgi:hypothetical protein